LLISGDAVERRRHQRYTCIFEATLESGEEQEFRPLKLARVVNLSRSGLSIHSAEQFEPGMRLRMMLNRGNQRVGPVELRVLHATEQPNRTWVMGGEFTSELDDEVVQFLLAD
jgi:hypothetical protein